MTTPRAAPPGSSSLPPSPAPETHFAVLRELTLELASAASATGEQAAADRVLAALLELLPGRALCIRVLDIRGREPGRAYHRNAPTRLGLDTDGVTLRGDIIKRALSTAVAASARVLARDRWDSPFTGIAHGFAIPLAAAGELYGVLDIGYPPAVAPSTAPYLTDEAAAQPIAAQLSLVLRTQRLAADATGLRDYHVRLLDGANALILGVDRGWRITVCNREFLELVEHTRESLLGTDLRDFIASDQRQHVTTILAAAIAGQHYQAVTILLPTPRGPVRTVWSLAPVGRLGGPVEAVIAVGQDQSKIDALQQQVVRTERLATLGQLAAGVVHELNNPLTSITVYSEYLVRKLESTGAEAGDVDKIKRIGASAQRILRFSRDLVQYARPSKKELEPVDLGQVVQQSVSICEHLVERGGVSLAIEIDRELPVVQAVAGQIEQVLINLITNAVHALEGGGGGTIRVRAVAQGGHTVLIEVGDSGAGIAEADREKIFEPFYTTKPDGKGTGLGLPIVRNIVEEHRGEISVTRCDLGGAAFRVVLPIS